MEPPAEMGIDTIESSREAIIDFSARRALLVGPYRSGRTSTLLDRCARLAQEGGRCVVIVQPSSLRPVASAATRRLGASAGLVTVRSWTGFGLDVLGTAGLDLTVIDATREHEILATLAGLPTDSLAAARLATAVSALRASSLDDEELRTHAEASERAGQIGTAAAWEEVITLAHAYLEHLRQHDLVDATEVLRQAIRVLRTEQGRSPWDEVHLLVDDYETASPLEHRLLVTVAGPARQRPASLVVAGNPHGASWMAHHGATALHRAHTSLEPELTIALPEPITYARMAPVRVRHGSLIGEAVVAEITELLATGYASDQIAVLLPHGAEGESIGSSVATVARRVGLVMSWQGERVGAEPVVQALAAALVAMLPGSDQQWPAEARALGLLASPADPATDLAATARALWEQLAPRLLGADGSEGPATPVETGPHPALRSVRSFIEALEERSSTIPSGPAPTALAKAITDSLRVPSKATHPHGIVMLSDRAAIGRSWRAVVLTGCEEGVRPAHPRSPVVAQAPTLDSALLDGPDVAGDRVRRVAALEEERRRFHNLRTRADDLVVAVAAPEPGVLVSRFLETDVPWTDAGLAAHRHHRLTPLALTISDLPFWPDGRVRASASSIETFRNCALQYTFGYVLGVRSPSGVSAAVGSFVHSIAEEYLDPTMQGARTWDRLVEIFERRWSDDLFTYRAQAAEYRGRVLTMLRDWFDSGDPIHADVVAVEHPFRFELGPHTISGFIDRIDSVPDPNAPTGTALAITDYKTGSSRGTGRASSSLQLGTYYLAAINDPALTRIGAPAMLRLLFLAENKEQHQPVTDDLAERWSEVLLSAANEIAQEPVSPSPIADCEYCDLQRLCPLQPEGRTLPGTAAKTAAAVRQ